MAGDGKPPRGGSLTATRGRGRALHYILQRTIVLDKVEVRSSNRLQRNAEVANDRDRFQENLGEQNGGAPVEVDAAGMHLLDEGAEQTKIEMRGGAEGSTVRGAMHVGNIGADSEMDSDGDALPVRGGEHAEIEMGCVD